MLTQTGKAFDSFCNDDDKVSAYFVDFCTSAFQAGQAYLEDQIHSQGAAVAPPTRWSYTFHSYTGNLATGNFSYFVLPGKYNGNFNKRSLDKPALEEPAFNPHAKRAIAAREEPSPTDKSLDKRLGGAVPIVPLPTPTHYPGQVNFPFPSLPPPLPIENTNPANLPPPGTGLRLDSKRQRGDPKGTIHTRLHRRWGQLARFQPVRYRPPLLARAAVWSRMLLW